MPRYKSLTYFSLEGEPIRSGQVLPAAFTADDAGHQVQLAQLVAEGTIVRWRGARERWRRVGTSITHPPRQSAAGAGDSPPLPGCLPGGADGARRNKRNTPTGGRAHATGAARLDQGLPTGVRRGGLRHRRVRPGGH